MTTRQQLQNFLVSQRAAQTAFLAELVKVPSDNPPGDCAPHAARATQLLRDLGFAVEQHPVPQDDCRANGMLSATNLIVRCRFGDGPTIALNAHGDVVPPGAGWSSDPYGAEIREGTMYGRGVAVSKSDFATYAYALLALQQLKQPLAGSIELHFTYDEEVGGEIGPKWLLDHGITKPDYAICAGFAYSIITAHNGCLHVEVTVRGKSAHAARPNTGADALEATNAILSALYQHRAGYARIRSATPGISHPTLVVGLINGGINTNVVPDRISFRLDRRMIPEEQPEQVEAELREVISAAVRNFPGISLEVRRVLLARALAPLNGGERLANAIARRAQEVFGSAIACEGTPLFTDARHYAAAGVPTILYGAGPRDLLEANGHRADERLKLDDLFGATEVVGLALLDLLSAK